MYYNNEYRNASKFWVSNTILQSIFMCLYHMDLLCAHYNIVFTSDCRHIKRGISFSQIGVLMGWKVPFMLINEHDSHENIFLIASHLYLPPLWIFSYICQFLLGTEEAFLRGNILKLMFHPLRPLLSILSIHCGSWGLMAISV